MVRRLIGMPVGNLPVDKQYSRHVQLRGDLRADLTCWRDYLTCLAWKHLMITQEGLKGCGWVKGHLVNIYVEFVLAALDGGNDLLRCMLGLFVL